MLTMLLAQMYSWPVAEDFNRKWKYVSFPQNIHEVQIFSQILCNYRNDKFQLNLSELMLSNSDESGVSELGMHAVLSSFCKRSLVMSEVRASCGLVNFQ